MKRSRSLVLTSLMAGAGISLTACDGASTAPQWGEGNGGKPVEAVSYASVAECKAAGKVAADQCQIAYDQAAKANATNAPRFGDQKSCEERFGVSQCVPRNEAGGGSFFTPLLTGFLIGRMFDGGGYRGAPMYRDTGGNYFGGAGNRISRDYVSGRSRIGSDAFDSAARAPVRVQSRSAVISRGGFGGGSRGFGG